MSLEYLAGFFDGEGCICCRNKIKQIIIEIGNTNPNLLLLFQKKFGGEIYKQKVNKKAGQVKIWYLYRIQKKFDILCFLKEISPYLIEKKPQAEIVIPFLEKYCNIRITKDANEEYEKLLKKMHKLKNKEYAEF